MPPAMTSRSRHATRPQALAADLGERVLVAVPGPAVKDLSPEMKDNGPA
jgi:hypothetical protein